MEHNFAQIQNTLEQLANGSRLDAFPLYPGITLSLLTVKAEQLSLRHAALSHILEINYCKAGRVGWKMESGSTVYLGPGDYSLHTMALCADSVMTLPNGDYEGLTLCIDLTALTREPPPLLADTGITGEFLLQKFCTRSPHISFAGNAQTEAVFSGFYGQPEALRLPYWRLKALELLLYLGKLQVTGNRPLTDYPAEQVELIRRVHEQLTAHLDQHFTIDALAKQFLINPTTLKAVFKAVYGNSIAAHTREHRMEQAARLLVETTDSIAKIAQAVGYENHSKFTAAFKEYFRVLPTAYRQGLCANTSAEPFS